MKCSECGAELAPNAKFCGKCGAKVKNRANAISFVPYDTANTADTISGINAADAADVADAIDATGVIGATGLIGATGVGDTTDLTSTTSLTDATGEINPTDATGVISPTDATDTTSFMSTTSPTDATSAFALQEKQSTNTMPLPVSCEVSAKGSPEQLPNAFFAEDPTRRVDFIPAQTAVQQPFNTGLQPGSFAGSGMNQNNFLPQNNASYIGVPPNGAKQKSTSRKVLFIILAVLVVVILVLLGVFAVRSWSHHMADKEEVSTSSAQKDNSGQSKEQSSHTQNKPTVNIPIDTSGPFWGVWAFTSKDKKEAENFARNLSEKGYKSCIVATTDWKNLDSEQRYAVTVGTWGSEADAKAMAKTLRQDGYNGVYVEHTGSHTNNNTVRLEVEASSGVMLTGEVRRDANDYVIADSSYHEYSVSELRSLNLSDAELCIAWNEPFAREGYIFYNSDLQEYFESCSWYVPKDRNVNASQVGLTNVGHLQEIAKQSSSAVRWMSLVKY